MPLEQILLTIFILYISFCALNVFMKSGAANVKACLPTPSNVCTLKNLRQKVEGLSHEKKINFIVRADLQAENTFHCRKLVCFCTNVAFKLLFEMQYRAKFYFF